MFLVLFFVAIFWRWPESGKPRLLSQDNLLQELVADSSSRNAVSISSACTTKRISVAAVSIRLKSLDIFDALRAMRMGESSVDEIRHLAWQNDLAAACHFHEREQKVSAITSSIVYSLK
jgi:hypothetical protein